MNSTRMLAWGGAKLTLQSGHLSAQSVMLGQQIIYFYVWSLSLRLCLKKSVETDYVQLTCSIKTQAHKFFFSGWGAKSTFCDINRNVTQT